MSIAELFEEQLNSKRLSGKHSTKSRKLPIARAFGHFLDSQPGVKNKNNIGKIHIHQFYESYKPRTARSLDTMKADFYGIELFCKIMNIAFRIPQPNVRHVNYRINKYKLNKMNKSE